MEEPISQYDKEEANNQKLFDEMFKQLKPHFWVLDNLLTQTKVNPLILIHVSRHLHTIASGTKWGEIRIQIENGVVKFVRGEESTRLEEPILIEKSPLDR